MSISLASPEAPQRTATTSRLDTKSQPSRSSWARKRGYRMVTKPRPGFNSINRTRHRCCGLRTSCSGTPLGSTWFQLRQALVSISPFLRYSSSEDRDRIPWILEAQHSRSNSALEAFNDEALIRRSFLVNVSSRTSRMDRMTPEIDERDLARSLQRRWRIDNESVI